MQRNDKLIFELVQTHTHAMSDDNEAYITKLNYTYVVQVYLLSTCILTSANELNEMNESERMNLGQSVESNTCSLFLFLLFFSFFLFPLLHLCMFSLRPFFKWCSSLHSANKQTSMYIFYLTYDSLVFICCWNTHSFNMNIFLSFRLARIQQPIDISSRQVSCGHVCRLVHDFMQQEASHSILL